MEEVPPNGGISYLPGFRCNEKIQVSNALKYNAQAVKDHASKDIFSK